MPQTQDMSPTPSQYTGTGRTCGCDIHWCWRSQWNTQLPILMSWVRSDRKILPRPSTHMYTPANTQLNEAVMEVVSKKLRRKVYYIHRVLNPWPVVCESIMLSARQQLSYCAYKCNNSFEYEKLWKPVSGWGWDITQHIQLALPDVRAIETMKVGGAYLFFVFLNVSRFL